MKNNFRVILLFASMLCGTGVQVTLAATASPPQAGLSMGAPQPNLVAVVSRKTHGSLGQFDLPVDFLQPVAGPVSIEPRHPGAAHVAVFQFDQLISSTGTLSVVDDAGGAIAGASALAAGMEIIVTLPAIADNRRITVSLANVSGSGRNVSASLGFLLGGMTAPGAMTTAQGAVTDAVIGATRARSGQGVDAGNFRFDLNTSGLISAADIAATRARKGAVLSPPPGAAWPQFGRNPQHQTQSGVASQSLSRIRWSTPVDLAPQYSGSILFAHYGSPVISARNTIMVPVKVAASGGFRMEARSGTSGALIWSAPTDYVLPPHQWLPGYNLTLTASSRVYAPGAGGKILFRDKVDDLNGTVQTSVFYGAAAYAGAAAIYDATVFINTPITADSAGNVFFGFFVNGSNPANLTSGFARIAANGTATWISAATSMATAIAGPMMNSAPALSIDQSTLYVSMRTAAVAGGTQTGYLVALDSTTLAVKSRVALIDPQTGGNVILTDNATSSPAVGPDGDVYYGALGASGAHASRGWMLHYDATLSIVKTPGAFGWDNTPSIVPAGMVPSYGGPSSYLLMSKYNSYSDGQHRIAILDPGQTQPDTNGGGVVMKEILTVLGPTPDPNNPFAVTEWCINTAAVDPATGSVLVNSEDGYLYRWNLSTNLLSERIRLTGGLGQAYTPTLVGPDGAVYAIGNAILFSVVN